MEDTPRIEIYKELLYKLENKNLTNIKNILNKMRLDYVYGKIDTKPNEPPPSTVVRKQEFNDDFKTLINELYKTKLFEAVKKADPSMLKNLINEMRELYKEYVMKYDTEAKATPKIVYVKNLEPFYENLKKIVDSYDDEGYAPLHWAVMPENDAATYKNPFLFLYHYRQNKIKKLECIKILIEECKADLFITVNNVSSYDTKTPLMIAEELDTNPPKKKKSKAKTIDDLDDGEAKTIDDLDDGEQLNETEDIVIKYLIRKTAEKDVKIQNYLKDKPDMTKFKNFKSQISDPYMLNYIQSQSKGFFRKLFRGGKKSKRRRTKNSKTKKRV
jgi:hypothetical protein